MSSERSSRARIPFEGLRDPLTLKVLTGDDVVLRCQACLTYQLEASWSQCEGCCVETCSWGSFWGIDENGFHASREDVEAFLVNPRSAPSEPACQLDTSRENIPPQQRRRRVQIGLSDLHRARRTPNLPPVEEIEDRGISVRRIHREESASGIRSDSSAPPVVSARKTGTRKLDRSRISMAGWSTSILDSARVLVVGAGAIGNEVLKNLALVGIGNIFVADLDTIDASNLTRAVLFSEHDIGRPKVDVVRERIQEIERDIHVQTFQGPFQTRLGAGAFRRFDIVFACVDNILARIDLAAACLATRTPMIEGGVLGLSGQASASLPPTTACFDCTLSANERKRAANRTSCKGIRYGEADRPSMPFTPTISSIVAGVMAQWGIQILHGTLGLREARRFRLTAGDGDCSMGAIRPSAECPTHQGTGCIVDNEIITRDDWSLKTTVAQVLHSARDYPTLTSGELAVELEFELATELTCQECGHSTSIRRREGDILLAEALCPNRCSVTNPMEPAYLHPPRIGPDHDLCTASLEELTFRPLDCIWVKNLDSGDSICFEIGGGMDELFGEFFYGKPKDLVPTDGGEV